MTRITGYQLKDGKLVPVRKRYDASTEAKRAGNKNKARPASRRAAQSVPKLERSGG